MLILASGSPRRRELLGAMGVIFEVAIAEVQELDATSNLSAADLATANARLKAVAIAERHPGRWILGSDTVVSHEGRLFGKPADLIEAREFLQTLSGRTHEVITACVLLGPDRETEVFQGVSQVQFRVLTDDRIARYLDAVDVLDKAGAYAAQEKGDWIIEAIHGSRDNVVGLPTEQLVKILRSRGLL